MNTRVIALTLLSSLIQIGCSDEKGLETLRTKESTQLDAYLSRLYYKLNGPTYYGPSNKEIFVYQLEYHEENEILLISIHVGPEFEGIEQLTPESDAIKETMISIGKEVAIDLGIEKRKSGNKSGLIQNALLWNRYRDLNREEEKLIEEITKQIHLTVTYAWDEDHFYEAIRDTNGKWVYNDKWLAEEEDFWANQTGDDNSE